jgi:hypothetical protein
MVKSRSGSSDVMSSTYVPMIGCFVAGFVTNRFLNHQNVVTGELEEGTSASGDVMSVVGIIVVVFVCLIVAGLWCMSSSNSERVSKKYTNRDVWRCFCGWCWKK